MRWQLRDGFDFLRNRKYVIRHKPDDGQTEELEITVDGDLCFETPQLSSALDQSVCFYARPLVTS